MTNVVLNEKVHVLLFYQLLNWKMHGETLKIKLTVWFL